VVSSGSTTATFTISTSAVYASSRATISAVSAGVTKTALLVDNPTVAASRNPAVQAGNPSGGNIVPTFSQTTPATWAVYDPSGTLVAGQGTGTPGANGWTAQISLYQDPDTLLIEIGDIALTAPASIQPATGYLAVVGIPNGVDTASKNAGYFDVVPAQPINLSSFSVVPSSVRGGTSATGTVLVDGPAPYGGTLITLSNSNTAAGTVPSSVTVAAGSTSQTFNITTPIVASTVNTNIGAIFNGATMYQQLAVTPTSAPLAVVSVSLNPPIVTGTNASTGTVTLGTSAPAGGAVVTLTSSNTSVVTVPASVTVLAGQTSATFNATSTAVATSTSVTVTASYNATASATMTVAPLSAISLTSLVISPAVVPGGLSTTGTVTISSPAPFGGIAVALSSTNTAAVSVPATVTVLQGSTTANFTVSTFAVSAATTATVSATYSGVTKTASVTVNLSPPAGLKAITLSPTTVIGAQTNGTNSTGTVALTGPAPVGGIVMALASSNPSVVSVPATLTVPAGSAATTFSATTFNVTSTQTITITATYGSSKVSATLTVNPWLKTLAISPTTLVGGSSTTGTITLNQGAPVGGIAVNLASSNTAAATIPDGPEVASGVLTIAAGATTATFTINTSPVILTSGVSITASYSGLTLTQGLTLQPLLQSLSLSPTTVTGGTSVTGTVHLNGNAPAGGVTISLASDNAAATVPSTLPIAAGANSGTFTISTASVSAVTHPNISASYGGVTVSQQFTINPIQVTLALNPTSLVGGGTVTGTITLNAAAPAGGLTVSLSSSSAKAPAPSSTVTVPAGTTTTTFTITTQTVTTITSATITASFGGLSSSAGLTLKPMLLSVSLSPSTVVGGNSSTGTVTLNDFAPTGGTPVTLSSSNAAATVLSSVTVPAGSKTATFTVSTTVVANFTSATITAGNAGATATTGLSIQPVLQSLSINPSSVYGGGNATGTVTLTAAAPAGGISIALTSGNTAVATILNSGSVSGGVLTIASGATSGTFTINTTAVSANSASTISAAFTSGAVMQTLSQTLTVIPLLSSISVSPNPLLGSGTGTGTVTLTGPAPAGGISVTLSSSNMSAATIPDGGNVTGGVLTIASGATSGTFSIAGSAVIASATTTISATYNGVTKTASLTVTPLLNTLSLSPSNIVGGDSSTGTISFNVSAPAGISLTITSSNPTVASVTSPVAVTSGSFSKTFTVTSTAVTTLTPVTISVSYGGVTRTATLNVYPMPTVLSLAPASSEVVGGNNVTETVTLTNIAPVGGAVVTLTSSNTAVATVPVSVTVSSGSSTASFTVTTISTATTANSTITAAYNSTTRTATVTVDRPSLSSLSFSPNSLPGGNTTTGTISLNGKAPTGGVSVDLSSSVSNGQNFLPSTLITIPAGSTSTTFQVATTTVLSPLTLNITATNHAYPAETVTANINLTLVSLRAVDIVLPKAIILNWAVPATGQYYLMRDGVTVAGPLPNTTRACTDIFNWNSGQTYKYDIYDNSTNPMTLLSSEQAVPYMMAATQDQAVDSRLDPRYSAVTLLNHNFGTSAYKGGLFAGFANDPSRVGRSFAQFTLNPTPTGGVYRTGKVNAALISGYSDGGAVSNLSIGCQALPITIAGYNIWDALTLNWSNAPMALNTAATQTVTVNYNPASNPPAYQWYSWKLDTDIFDAILGIADAAHDGTNKMSVQWASMNEGTYGWAYFAKNEYDPTLGPNVTNLWSIPTLVKLTVPSPVTLSGAASTSATGQVSVNGIGLQGSAVVSLSSSSPLVTFQATGTQSQSMTVTGLNTTFTMNVTKPSASTAVTITATLGTVTKTVTMTVNP